MRWKTRIRVLAIIIVIFGQSVIPAKVHAADFLARLKSLVHKSPYQGTKPSMGHDCTMECLAQNIDWLEHHVDTYGSIVAKQPDIWGEARLTKHRDEYERIMFDQLGDFSETVNATIRQGDAAFISQAIALSAAAGGNVPALPDLVDAGGDGSVLPDLPDSEQAGIALEPSIVLDQRSRYLQHLHELRRINEGDDTSDSPGYSLNLVRIPVSILPGKFTREGYGAEITITAEPVISDDLMPTTFQNLAVNDVVDMLGLPLVRLTEELDAFAAKVSKQEFEAESQQIGLLIEKYKQDCDQRSFNCSATPHIHRILENSLALTQLIAKYKAAIKLKKGPKGGTKSSSGSTDDVSLSDSLVITQDWIDTTSPLMSPEEMRAHENAVRAFILPKIQSLNEATQLESFESQSQGDPNSESELPAPLPSSSTVGLLERLNKALSEKDVDAILQATIELVNQPKEDEISKTVADATNAALEELSKTAAGIGTAAPSGRTRRALNPLNPSYLEKAIGLKNLLTVSSFLQESYFGRHIRWAGGRPDKECGDNRVNLLDARRFLNAEIQAAYEMLSEPEHVELFAELAGPNSMLASQIRSGHFDSTGRHSPGVNQYRYYFFKKLHHHGVMGQEEVIFDSTYPVNASSDDMATLSMIASTTEEHSDSSVETLAWAVVLECALLNERLNRDVRKLAKATQEISLDSQKNEWFFLPDTVTYPGTGLDWLRAEFQSATEVFKEYVRVRWPIHVFAVEPVTQDQNVRDISQRKRELQFAMSMAFVSGMIGANSMTQFSRQLETEIDTISLNRTILAFGHGNDTFGWRFQPRVQPLEVPGTLGAIRETICGTSRDCDLGQRRLEPGKRECVAIVLMPSFVPYADFDIRSNWYRLTNPKDAALTMKDNLMLSRAVTSMRNSHSQCAQCQHLYRDGELRRLFKRVDQLEHELCLQTRRALVPYENTLGGFEMFNTGVTDLAPELIGWYGAPGIRIKSKDTETDCGCVAECSTDATTTRAVDDVPLACPGAGTTLFLVGDNFSIHDTKVIAGGTCIPDVRLISRELMQVTIPSCVNKVKLCEQKKTKEYVAIYVSTPYGVTNHLHVPVHSKGESEASALAKKIADIEKKIAHLPPAVATIAPNNADNKVVKATATVDSGLYVRLAVNAQSAKLIKYAAGNDPRFVGTFGSIKAAVRNEKQFLTGLVDIEHVSFLAGTTFRALGPLGDDGQHPILQVLAGALKSSDLPTDGKPLKLKIVYYVQLDGQDTMTPLKEEVGLEIIRADCACPGAKATTTSAVTPTAPEAVKGEPTAADAMGTLRLQPVPKSKDCNCVGSIMPSDGQIQPVHYRTTSSPLRLTESLEVAIAEPTIRMPEISDRLDRLEEMLNNAIGSPQTKTTETEVSSTVPKSSESTSSQITVRVVMETAEKGWECFDPKSFPLLNRLKIHSGEKWRNLRDHVSCD